MASIALNLVADPDDLVLEVLDVVGGLDHALPLGSRDISALRGADKLVGNVLQVSGTFQTVRCNGVGCDPGLGFLNESFDRVEAALASWTIRCMGPH